MIFLAFLILGNEQPAVLSVSYFSVVLVWPLSESPFKVIWTNKGLFPKVLLDWGAVRTCFCLESRF